MEFGKGEFRGAVNGNEQVELPFLGLHVGNVDVKIADGIGFTDASAEN